MHPKMFLARMVGRSFHVETPKGRYFFERVYENPERPKSRAARAWHPGVRGFGNEWGATFYISLTCEDAAECFTPEQVRQFVVEARCRQVAEILRHSHAEALTFEDNGEIVDVLYYSPDRVSQTGNWSAVREGDREGKFVSVRVEQLEDAESIDRKGSAGRLVGPFMDNMRALGKSIEEHFRQQPIVLQIDRGGLLERTFVIDC